MFKYQFELKQELTSCDDCPILDGEYGRCNLNYRIQYDFEKIPDDCPLQKVTEEKEGK